MIARRALLSVLNNVAGALLGLVALNFVTAYGGKNAWGMWVYASALLALASLPAGLGFANAHVHRVSHGAPEARANATFLWIKLSLTGGFVLVAVGAVLVWTRLLGRPLSDTTEAALVVAVAFYALMSLRQFFDVTFQAHRLVATYESVLLIDTVASTASVMTTAMTIARLNGASVPFPAWADLAIAALGLEGPVSEPLAAYYIALAYLAGKLASFAYALFQFRHHHHPLGRPSRTLLHSYARYALPLAIVGVLATVTAQLDRVFLGFFGTSATVADYSLAFLLLSPMSIASTALAFILFPTLSRLHANPEPETTRQIVREAERLLSMILVPQAMLALIFAPQAVRVATSSQAFEGAVLVLRVLTVFYFFQSLAVPTRALLMGFDQPGFLARLGAVNVGLVAVLNLVAIPDDLFGIPLLGLGAVGAAGTSALVAVFTYAWVNHRVRHLVPRALVPPHLGRQVAAATVAAAATWALQDAIGPEAFDHALELAAIGAFGIAVYLAALVSLRGFGRADLRLLLDLLHPGRLAAAFGTEWTSRRPRHPKRQR